MIDRDAKLFAEQEPTVLNQDNALNVSVCIVVAKQFASANTAKGTAIVVDDNISKQVYSCCR